MCGIVCAFNINSNSDKVRSNVLKMAKKVRHRGPDWSGVYSNHNAVLAHERLAIVDPTSGKQPIISEDGCKVIAVNSIEHGPAINRNLFFDILSVIIFTFFLLQIYFHLHTYKPLHLIYELDYNHEWQLSSRYPLNSTF